MFQSELHVFDHTKFQNICVQYRVIYQFTSSRSQLTKCDKCDYVGASTGALTYHVQIKHLKMFRYECPKCDKFKTQTKPQIVKHLMEEHDVLEEDINNLVKSKLRLQDISTLIFFIIFHMLLNKQWPKRTLLNQSLTKKTC